MLTRKQVDKLTKGMKGEIRGIAFEANCNFILQREGPEGVKKLDNKMKELGFDLKCRNIKPMDFYSMKLALPFMLALKEVFNLNNKDFETVGVLSVKFNLFVKVFMKYFSSLDLVARQIPKMWRKHYTIGNLEMPEYSREKRYVILRLKNFYVHPLYCSNFKGYFTKISEMVLSSKVKCQETKCMHKGDPYHEFLLTW